MQTAHTFLSVYSQLCINVQYDADEKLLWIIELAFPFWKGRVTHHSVPKGKDLFTYVARAATARCYRYAYAPFCIAEECMRCVCVCVCVRITGWWVWRIEGRNESQELIVSAETISFRCFVAYCELAAHRWCWCWVYLVDSRVTDTGHIDIKPIRPRLHFVMQGQKLKFHVGCLFGRFYRNLVMCVIAGFVSEVSIFVLLECVSPFIS